jgi:hypothetical protein
MSFVSLSIENTAEGLLRPSAAEGLLRTLSGRGLHKRNPAQYEMQSTFHVCAGQLSVRVGIVMA